MHTELQSALEEYRKVRAFDAQAWLDDKSSKFNAYMRRCGLKASVVSVSGGLDSAVTLAIAKYAQQEEDSPVERVVGVCQPIHSSDWALQRGKEVCEALSAECVVVDQSDIHDLLCARVQTAFHSQGSEFARGQLRSYLRTPVAYFSAQLMSAQGQPCVVLGTGNQDEDGYLAYFCKAGDGVVDVQLISDLHKSEVFKVGALLKVPASILEASPSADLWDGHTDEEELGFSYDFVELLTGVFLPKSEEERTQFLASLSAEARSEFQTKSAAAESVHRRNRHKLNFPVNL
ncbi:MAG: hypothetical protein MHM6MM_007647 [Cercozoa sp. M6MM]